MLECRGKVVDGEVIGACRSNAGLLVQKGKDKRLTVAAHGWETDKTGAVYHGQKIVGYITEVLDEDIGMLDPAVPVCNDFLQANCNARNLISCRDIEIGDICCVDSCYTGPQRLGFAGTRYGKRRPRKHEPAWPHFYIVLEQGIYSAQIPFVPQPPLVKLGQCGTPLLRVANVLDVSVAPVGDVLGFFLWTDIVRYGGPSLYCYTQSCDPLIEEGWQVAEEMGKGEDMRKIM